MFEIIKFAADRIDIMVETVRSLLPALGSEYVTEQLMLSAMDHKFALIWMTVSIVSLVVGIIGIIISRRNYDGATIAAVGFVVLVVSGVIALGCYFNSIRHGINAATPILNLTREALNKII